MLQTCSSVMPCAVLLVGGISTFRLLSPLRWSSVALQRWTRHLLFFPCLACATRACCVGLRPHATPLQICFRLLYAGAGRPVPLQSCHSSQFLPGGDPFCVLLQCRWRKFFVTLAATRGSGRPVCPRRPARASGTTDQSCRRCASRVRCCGPKRHCLSACARSSLQFAPEAIL